jgi:hypothetical protein
VARLRGEEHRVTQIPEQVEPLLALDYLSVHDVVALEVQAPPVTAALAEAGVRVFPDRSLLVVGVLGTSAFAEGFATTAHR